MTLLVLWDIDGTLVDAAGFGSRVAGLAYEQVVGVPMTTAVPMAGRTDRAIYSHVLEVNGGAETDLAAFCQAIGLVAEASHHDLLAGGGRALPGALEAIAALGEQPDVVQSVLTGNLRALGLVKLGALGLLDRLDIEVAAFGDDHLVRAHLVDVARDLFRARDGSAPDTVLIGDTPLDVEAARESGAGIVAVATGHYSADELAAAGAPVVLPDLTDPHRLVAEVLTARTPSAVA